MFDTSADDFPECCWRDIEQKSQLANAVGDVKTRSRVCMS